MNTEERLVKLEARIKILEKELYELKKKVASIKGTEDVVFDATDDSIYGMSIEDMELSVRTYNCLKRAEIHNLGELVLLSEADFMQIRNLGKKPCEEILSKIKELTSDHSDAVEKIQAETKEAFEMSKKFVPALEVYGRIREKAKEKGIQFSVLGRYGKFPQLYRLGFNAIMESLEGGKSILSRAFCQSIRNGEYPKMKEYFEAEVIDFSLIKAVIIEDLAEASQYLNKQTYTYKQLLKFLQLIQEYKEE